VGLQVLALFILSPAATAWGNLRNESDTPAGRSKSLLRHALREGLFRVIYGFEMSSCLEW
jgi:hypothetical protein